MSRVLRHFFKFFLIFFRLFFGCFPSLPVPTAADAPFQPSNASFIIYKSRKIPILTTKHIKNAPKQSLQLFQSETVFYPTHRVKYIVIMRLLIFSGLRSQKLYREYSYKRQIRFRTRIFLSFNLWQSQQKKRFVFRKPLKTLDKSKVLGI